MISKEQIKELSQRFSIDEFTVLREYIQIVFLGVLYSRKESQDIYFKGGTAIHLLLKASRFSEDLDFTAKLTTAELKDCLEDVLKKVNLVILGTSLKKIDVGNKSLSGILSYQTEEMKFPLNIHIEFSIREKPFTEEEKVLETDFPVSPQPVIRHLGWQEILSEKIRAFMLRAKGRDIYDLWYLLSKGIDVNWKMVNKKLEFYEKTVSFQDICDKVSKFDDKRIKDDLQKFLPAYDRNLVVHLKELLLKQLFSREEFVIRNSDNLDFSKMPGGAFSGTEKFFYDLKKTKIVLIERENKNVLRIDIKTDTGSEKHGWLRARNNNGVRELDIIEKNKSAFKGKSYDDLINYKFNRGKDENKRP